MKTSVITTLVAVPLLSLSSMAFAAEPGSAEPTLLSAVEMDGITAGTYSRNYADVTQINRVRVTVTQTSTGNTATGGDGGSGGEGGWGFGGFGVGGVAVGGTASANGTGGNGTGGAGGAGGAGGSASAGNQSAFVATGNISVIRQHL